VILSVDREAQPEELKRAYKQLALKHHPVSAIPCLHIHGSKIWRLHGLGTHARRHTCKCLPHANPPQDKNDSPEAHEQFQKISLAYRVLSDPDKRRCA
jgi:hypothetical protein